MQMFHIKSLKMKAIHIVYLMQKKKSEPEKAVSRKRKSEPEMGSERRNPSRKARPPENFGVEEKSETLPCRSPRTVDIRRLVEV